MGTRGLLGIVADGKEVFTYNHYDSYPEGLGADVLKFAREMDKDSVREQVAKMVSVDETTKPPPEAFGRWSDRGVSTGDDWYSALRNTQGDLEAILESGHFVDSKEFAGDSLFCEWGYVVDLDNNTFEVYKGFNTSEGVRGRFADYNAGDYSNIGTQYYPITLVAGWSLNGLPDDKGFAETFVDNYNDDDI